MTSRFAPLSAFHVFSVEDRSIQLGWSAIASGPLQLQVGPHVIEVDHEGPAGALTISGLRPDTSYSCVLKHPRSGRELWASTRTLPSPPGPELCRIATVNDLHVGSKAFGFTHTISERPAPRRHSGLRCAGAALDELTDWGTQHLFIKGDAVHKNLPSEWEALGQMLADRPWSADIGFGNHERRNDALAHRGVANAGLSPVRPVRWADLPGVRIIMFETALPGTNRGVIDTEHAEEVAQLARETELPVMLFLHQQLEARRLPLMLPVGIRVDEAEPFLRSLGAANRNVIVASGHTHRHRRRDLRSYGNPAGMVTVVEVGSPKDFPGTWTGYAVHEGGIRQVVRRVERPDCIAWTHRTRRAALGVWGRWSPGTLAQRCWTRMW